MNKTEELIGIFGTLCDYMVDNGRCDVFCPYAETKDKDDECEAWRTITEALKGGLRMTLDEAIKWYKDKEAEYRDLAKEKHKNFAMIAEQYQQFAEWLMELKDLREENKFLISEFDRLIKEKGEHIAEYKRLLKAAIKDLNATATEVYNGGVICGCCKWESQIGECSCPDDGGCDTDYQWRYADEALTLIGDESNGI